MYFHYNFDSNDDDDNDNIDDDEEGKKALYGKDELTRNMTMTMKIAACQFSFCHKSLI